MKYFIAFCTLVLAVGNAGAETDGEVSFKQDLQPIFNSKCVFCHITEAANGGLNLSRRDAYEALVNTPSTQSDLLRVKPGAADESYLINKLKDTQLEAGGSGNAMPMVDPPRAFDPQLLELIERWINDGAPDN